MRVRSLRWLGQLMWLLDLCGGQASIAWENWFVDFVRNALLRRRTSPHWSVGANINFRPWQQVAKRWGSKRNRDGKGGGGVRCQQFPCSCCCCCASRCLCVICQFTQILLALLVWNAKSSANLLRAWASWPPLPLPLPPSLFSLPLATLLGCQLTVTVTGSRAPDILELATATARISCSPHIYFVCPSLVFI